MVLMTTKFREILEGLAAILISAGALVSEPSAYAYPARKGEPGNNQQSFSAPTLRAMISQAEELRRSGQFTKAATIWSEILSFSERALGPNSLAVATSLSNLAGLISDTGDYTAAKTMYERSLAIRENKLGSEHLDVALSLNNLAYIHLKQGRYSIAEALYQRSLHITQKGLGPDHPDFANTLNNLAEIARMRGRYTDAEPLYRRSLNIFEKALGGTHPQVAMSLNNLAVLSQTRGQYSLAESLSRQTLAILEKFHGPSHPDVATSLNNLALALGAQEKYAEAEAIHRRSLAIQEKYLGQNHPDIAISLTNIAAVSEKQRPRFSHTELLYRRSLSIFEKALGPNHPYVSTSLGNLSAHLHDQGKLQEAVGFSQRALASFEKGLGLDHPDASFNLSYLASLLMANGDKHDAIFTMKHSLALHLTWLRRELPLLSAQSRYNQLKHFGKLWEVPFGWIDLTSDAAPLALETRLNRQGFLQEIEHLQALLVNTSGVNTTKVEQLQTLTQQLSSVLLSAEIRAEIRQQRDKLQADLYREFPELKLQFVTGAEVAKALPTDGVLVEFQRYRSYDAGKSKDQRWGAPKYIVLVLKPDGRISAVPLGPAGPIEDQVHKALRATSEKLTDAEAIREQLSRLVIKPLLPHLSGSRQWFLSPDGELNRVPFGALPAPQQPSMPLAKAVQLRVLTSGRELLRLQQPAQAGSKALVMVNPSFDRPITKPAPAANIESAASTGQQRSAELASNQWSPLPASEQEGQQVANILGTGLISGAAANTKALQRLQGPQVLHVATHGFFVADQESKPSEGMKSIQEGSPLLHSLRQEDPQLRSGLVLAGANQPDLDPNDDGYLTAAEAVNLNLKGTELVVLSACSTGQGEVRTGEGVYGLQRSLTVAGARSTLLSLWKVGDAATAEFMVRFYQRLKAGEGRSEALARVQDDFRTGKVKSPDGNNWKEPYYWAAWQLVGDWRPIKGL